MSASDSDTSIDWLATDNEDDDNEREPDCTGESSQTQAPLSPVLSDSSGKVEDNGGSFAVDSSQRCPSGRTWMRDRDSSGLCQTQRGENMGGEVARGTLKRPCDAVLEEPKVQPHAASASEDGQTFTSKCYELQCYIQPLSSILNGLRSGRYRGRLSSFQESVAMDRIQRIMGVLQNPRLGEKYVHIILKMEEMLKSWFPNVKPRDQLAAIQTEEVAPTKKRKLSQVTAALADAPASPIATGAPPVGAKALRVTDLTPPGAYSASNLKWLHTSPICSPTAEQAQAGPSPLLPPRELMQDDAVSSSTDNHSKTDSIPKGPPLGKINAPCLEQLLKSTESIIALKGAAGVKSSSRS